jgi:hypothetical protein
MATTASPASTAAFPRRARFVDHDCTAQKILAVQRGDRFIRLSIVGDLDKAEASRLAGETISNQRHRIRLDTRIGKLRSQILLACLKRQVTYI